MKNALWISALAFAVVACGGGNNQEAVEATDAQAVEAPAASADLAANTATSTIKWVGFKTFVDWKHNGTVALQSGNFKLENGKIVGGSFVIDMNSIVCLDMSQDDPKYGDLIGHLKSQDFFAVDSFPTAQFEITSIAEGTDGMSTVSGNLTMRGITKNISFPAHLMVDGNKAMLHAPEFTIKRTDWNVMFNNSGMKALAKDKLIDDNIKLELSIEA